MNKLTKNSAVLPWVMCGLAAIYYCYEYFLRISPSVMRPELMHMYNLDGAQFGNLFAIYYYIYVPMQILVGLLMDRYGPRRLLTLACILCAFGSYLFACSSVLLVAQLGRLLVGFGSAFAFVGAIKLATIWLPPNRFALLSGIIMCLGMVGGMVGDFLLRAMVDALGWEAAIYVSAIAGIVLAFALWGVIRDRNPNNKYQVHEVIHFKELLLGLGNALKDPQIWINGTIGLVLYLALSLFAESWGISYLEEGQGLSKMSAVGANSMIFLGWAIGSPFWGWFSDIIGRRNLPIMFATILSLILICIVLYVPGIPATVLYVLLFIFGIMTSAQILVFAVCHEISSPKITATAIALTNMIIMFGGIVFQPMAGKILDIFWTGAMLDGARAYPAIAYQWALSVLPVCLFVAVVLVCFMRETYCEVKLENYHPH